jgi:folate-binding protein YgfZ
VSRSASDPLDLDGGHAAFPDWELIEVSGGDRERFLSSQLTSDVARLPVGESQPTALLDRSGRLQGFGFLVKRELAIGLLLPGEVSEHVVSRLDDHVIADDVTFAAKRVGQMRLVLGPAAVAEPGGADRFPIEGWGSRGYVTWGDIPTQLPELPVDELEARRVLGGPPVWGRDARPGQLINETPLLETAVSFDKGCYLGQETVAKIASHRGAARGAALLELDPCSPGGPELEGLAFAVGDQQRAGEVRAAARWDDRVWLLLSLRRELRVFGRELHCDVGDDRSIVGLLHPAPLLPTPTRDELAARLTDAASSAFAANDADRALELLERAQLIAPDFADAVESVGVILGRLGRYDEAIERMERLLEIEPSSVMAHSNLSLFHNQLGDKERAEHHLALATRASFGGAAASATAASERRAADAAEADRRRREEMFRQVLEIDPDDALAHFGLGELAAERDRLDEAVGHLERALASDPGHAAAILALGAVFERLEKPDRAHEIYNRGIEVAAKRGDTAAAAKMQTRLSALNALRRNDELSIMNDE